MSQIETKGLHLFKKNINSFPQHSAKVVCICHKTFKYISQYTKQRGISSNYMSMIIPYIYTQVCK